MKIIFGESTSLKTRLREKQNGSETTPLADRQIKRKCHSFNEVPKEFLF